MLLNIVERNEWKSRQPEKNKAIYEDEYCSTQ